MGFIGVQPATVPLTTSDITNDIVNSDKIADDSISEEHIDNTAITGHSAITSLADTDKFLVSDASDSGNLKYVEKQYLPSGSLTETGSLYFESTNSTNEMNIENCFSSTYNMYLVKFQVLPSANSAGLTMRAKHSSGSMSGSHYDYVSRSRSTAGSDGEHRGTEQNKIILSGAVTSREYDTGAWGEFYIWTNTNRSASATFSCTGRYGVMTSNSGGDTKIYTHVSQYQRTVTDAGALTGIQWYWESGNTEQANIKVYGLLGSNA